MPKEQITFPSKVVRPVRRFLKDQLKRLESTKKDVVEDDPFSDPGRATDNAAPDTDAEEQFGHDRASAVKDHLDRTIIQTKQALTRIKIGKYGICDDCGNMIDTDRLMIKPEATMCVKCEAKKENK